MSANVMRTTWGGLAASQAPLVRLVESGALEFDRVKDFKEAMLEQLRLYDAAREALLAKYGTLNEAGTAYDIPDRGKREEFAQKNRELTATEVVIPGERIALDRLNGVSISAEDLAALAWLITEEREGIMPEAGQWRFSFTELATMMVKQAGVREGWWGINVEFNSQGMNVPSQVGKVVPAVLTGITSIGLQRFPGPHELAVDAAKVWEQEESNFLEKISTPADGA